MTHIEAPFGTWQSNVSPELMARGGLRIGFPEVLPDGSFAWLEGRPDQGGRSVVVRGDRSGTVRDVSPAGRSARSRVNEYGGRGHVFDRDALLFACAKDQHLYRADEAGERQVSAHPGWRFAEPIADSHGRLITLGELHTPGQRFPENGIASVDVASGEVRWIARGHDFYAAPALSPDGRTLAFLAWDLPHMPWDAARLYVAEVQGDGTLSAPRAIAGGPEGSAFQPMFAPDGALYASIEVDDRWTLHRIAGDRLVRLPAIDLEIGAPLWQLGAKLYGFADAGTLIAAGLRDGRSHVVRLDLAGGRWTTLRDDLGHVGELACRGRDVLCVIGWAGQGSRLVHLDLDGGEGGAVRDAFAGLVDPEDVSAPEPITFATDGDDVAHGFHYQPRSRRFRGPEATRPPLVVLAHGGPTGCANATLQLSVQFWTTRGFAVLDVNYRGSTGFGRAYREKLRGRWGVVDVSDCVAGVRHLAERDLIDPRRTIIRGGSAGGYTVLQALTDHDVFRSAACLYGPSDPSTFTEETHKFEVRYDHFLFGTGADYDAALAQRAPIRKVGRIRAPVIFFQGMDDPAVKPEQTRRVYDALVERGVETEYHGYADEEHGFRRAETIRDVWEKELAFHRRVLGLEREL